MISWRAVEVAVWGRAGAMRGQRVLLGTSPKLLHEP